MSQVREQFLALSGREPCVFARLWSGVCLLSGRPTQANEKPSKDCDHRTNKYGNRERHQSPFALMEINAGEECIAFHDALRERASDGDGRLCSLVFRHSR